MDTNKMIIKKTKYRYLMDNFKIFPIRNIITYTIPVPKDPSVDESKQEFFDRNYPEVSITNIHFKHMVDKTAKALIAYGVKKGDIVTICQTNTPEILYMDYALNKIGAVPNYIYPNVTSDEMKYYMEELDSKYMFILDDDPIRKNVKEATKGKDIKIISSSVIESFNAMFKKVAGKKMPANKVVLENEIKWNDFMKKGKKIKKVKEDEYRPNTISSYIHTSGTSSTPKAVCITNENDNQVVRNYYLDKVNFQRGGKVLQTIPQFVEYGKTTNHNALCLGLNLIFIPEMEPRNYYDLIKKYNPEYSYSTPSHARELIKRPTNMSKAKNYLFGGDGFDDVEEKLNNYFKENGSNAVAFQGYGLTEFSAVDIINRPNNHKIGSIGKLCGKTEAVIIDPETKEVITEPNKVGELCFTGPGLTLGYAGNSEEENEKVYVKHDDENTYVHTGDYISCDEDGFFYYHGRIKNIIFRNSFKVPPKDIASYVEKHENVKQCVVVPKYSETEGETPSVHITLYDYSKVDQTLDELVNMINNSSSINETYKPTDYKVRKKMVISRNNKMDITALKIEDTISMYPGVIKADIRSVHDGEYDYEIDILFNSNVNKDIKEEDIKKFLNEIATIKKFKVGKIKYNIEKINILYEDDAKINEKVQNYVKHV